MGEGYNMAISPDPTVPNIIYLDEQAISDALSYMGQGIISEIAERSLTEDESTKEAGFRKVLTGRFASRDMEASETEIVRRLDPIGQLAMLQEGLKEEDMLQTPGDDFNRNDRAELQQGQILEADCTLRQTPIKSTQEIVDQFAKFQATIASLSETEVEDTEETEQIQTLLSALDREGDILRAVLSSEAACNFVLTHDGSNFRNKPLNFPREQDTYTALGQVTGKFDEGESISLIDFVDLANQVKDNPRERKTEVMNLKRQFAKAASRVSNRDISTHEFEIAHPDVQVKLFAIYQ